MIKKSPGVNQVIVVINYCSKVVIIMHSGRICSMMISLSKLDFHTTNLSVKTSINLAKISLLRYDFVLCPIDPQLYECGCCGTKSLAKLQKFQNREARMMTNSPFIMSAHTIISHLRWYHGCINHDLLECLTELFQRLSETSAI